MLLTGAPMTILTVPPSSTSGAVHESARWLFEGQGYESAPVTNREPEQRLLSGIDVVPWLTPEGIILGSLLNSVMGSLAAISPACAERMKRLGELEPNWDGYGAEAISEIAVERCAELMARIHQAVGLYSEHLFIAPLANGGLELEWEMPSGNELMLVVPPFSGPIEFLASTIDPSSGEEREHEGDIPSDAYLEDLLGMLLA